LTVPAYQFVRRDGLEWLECPALSRLPWLVHGFSTRTDWKAGRSSRGFTLGYGASSRRSSRMDRNRRRFFSALGAQDFLPASLRQIHSAGVWCAAHSPKGCGLAYVPCGSPVTETSQGAEPQGDALMTHEPGILLGVRVADCMPILLADARRRAVAAIHAGWRGALARIIEKAVGDLRRIYGSKPADLIAAVGPSIRACCYEVGGELVEVFSGSFASAEKFFRQVSPADLGREPAPRVSPWLFKEPPGHAPEPAAHLDVAAVALDQLERAGLKASRIHLADFCTACRTDLFFSYRKEGERAGRMMAVIGIRA
jgi:YfiH family protein